MSQQQQSDDESSHSKSSKFSILKTITKSLKIFLRNKHHFISTFTFLTLPLSLLLFSLSLSSHPIKSRIYHLESVAFVSSARGGRFEARHVWKESRADAVSLLRLKSYYFLPSLILSLLTSITAVNSTALSFNNKKPSLHTALAAVKLAWKRLFVTSLLIYSLLLLYSEVPRVLAAIVGVAGGPGLSFSVLVIGSGFEVYLMAVLGLGLVVSVMEEKFGWEAIRVGSGLMEGRRVSGWVLSGLGVLVSGWIGWRMERVMEGLDFDLKEVTIWTVVMSGWDKVGLICGYGLFVIWSYIVTTVFYCKCRKRHDVIRGGEIDSVVIV